MTMISQILNRGFMLEQIEDISQQLRKDVQQKRVGGPADEALEAGDYTTALEFVEVALENERKQSSGQLGFEPPAGERRSDWPADLDDYSFFSHDPIVSIVQSAIEHYFNQPENADSVVTQELIDDERRGPDDEPVVTDRSLKGYQPSRDPDGRRLFDKFSITDARWVSSAVAMGVRLFRKRRAFNQTPPKPVELSAQARVILVGDWGTGIPRAQKVGTAMRMVVEQSVREKRDVHVVHLGDVYYSGWDYEYRRRFLPYWPVRESETGKAGSWCLNGNHDMYSGGFAYFDTLLKDPRFARQGQASFFRLYNRDWQLLGLDTSWDDNGLKDPQDSFVKQTLKENKQKVIMLTHHQFFSAYEDTADMGAVLNNKLRSVLEGNRIDAAFWGHEHRCVAYEPWKQVKFGRLIGHGGVPVYMTHEEGEPYVRPATYEYRRSIDKGLERWALFGFAILDFDGSKLHVRYVDENGTTHKDETIE
jgi:hypothetical protein